MKNIDSALAIANNVNHQLIKVEVKDGKQLVNGKELHEFLEIKTAYKDWFPRMCAYGFEEGKDFCSILSQSTGGRPGTDHALTIEMAKEISMIQRTEKGRQARQYFIECEKQLKELHSLNCLSAEMQAVIILDKRSQEHSERISKLEDNIHIDRLQKKQLREFISTVVINACGTKYSKAFKEFGKKTYSSIYHDLYNAFGISAYEEIPKLKFQDALKFINNWTPNRELQLLIRGSNMEGASDSNENFRR